MNEITRTRAQRRETTQAADGFPRLKWTLAEFERLSELGFFGGIDRPRERVELIDGELVPMNAKGARHEWVRAVIQNYLAKRLPDGLWLLNEPGWRPGGARYFEPEMIICKAGNRPSSVSPADVLLLVEVADSSLIYDSGLKARIYASLGVTEYWVINANTLMTTIHRAPEPTGYADIVKHPSSDTLTPLRVPELPLRLADLGLDE